MAELLWPVFDGLSDLASMEAVPLADRGLPDTTYDLLARAAALWPDRVALSVIPDASRFEHSVERTFAGLLADVHAYANVFHAHLPVTPVGKAFKPALRAVAARGAVAEALRGVPCATSVRGVVEHGAGVVVGLAEGADETPLKEMLDRFSISWRAEADR